jgi:RimJ/RimL family protein N-acetyltransferase
MPGPAFCRGDAVALHPIEEADLPFVQRHSNDPAIRAGLTTATPQNAYEAEQAHERHQDDDSGVGLLVVPREPSEDGSERATGERQRDASNASVSKRRTDSVRESSDPGADEADPVGSIVLFGIDETHGTGELACWIAPDAQGNGYAQAATHLMLDHAFGGRRLHKVVARALVGNAPSRATLEAVGFVEEGVQRDEKYVNGEYRDVVRYSVLADEWGDD